MSREIISLFNFSSVYLHIKNQKSTSFPFKSVIKKKGNRIVYGDYLFLLPFLLLFLNFPIHSFFPLCLHTYKKLENCKFSSNLFLQLITSITLFLFFISATYVFMHLARKEES